MTNGLRLFALTTAFAASSSLASEAPPGELVSRLAVTGDFTSVFLINSIGASGSWRVLPQLAFSAGFGAGFALRLGPPVTFWATQLMAHGLFGGQRHLFEIAAGVSLVRGDEYPPFMNVFKLSQTFALLPAAFAGYRYQQRSAGLVVRAGLALHYGFNPGMALSVGYSF